jgi:hypothetical protein
MPIGAAGLNAMTRRKDEITAHSNFRTFAPVRFSVARLHKPGFLQSRLSDRRDRRGASKLLHRRSDFQPLLVSDRR